MTGGVVAKRYALALFQIAKEKESVDQFAEELRVVKHVFTENSDLLQVLAHPKVSLENKKAMLKEAFASLTTEVLNTLLLLVENKRINIVNELQDCYVQLANEEQGTEDAKVYSVRPLKDEELKALSEVFAKKIGKQSLRLENIIDQSLIGGIKLRIGNRIYDGSVSGKLERIERELVAKSS
ncbi:F0F1 ATP synthase subunit delta [Aeribacillus alveayuensis]|jgi:F-type H+-transporting ATPase subunit delta|uniref:ATP synthase subunit delta n=1 Tax=Aeribacillus alveayuensis TaxID=279215 RepID=A0ABT9VNQ3_9BACI|nr:F-type H+-transporting ATPase subunit delta [Bacillus alveayuensis]